MSYMDGQRFERKDRSWRPLGRGYRVSLAILFVVAGTLAVPACDDLLTRLSRANIVRDATNSNPRRDVDPGIGGPGRSTIPSGSNR